MAAIALAALSQFGLCQSFNIQLENVSCGWNFPLEALQFAIAEVTGWSTPMDSVPAGSCKM